MAQHTPLHAELAGLVPGEIKIDAPPRAELGDFAVGCFALAKARNQSPAQVAKDIAAAFRPTALIASATATGPFVNFRADRAATSRWVIGAALAGTLLPRAYGAGKTITIDYGSPNISKHLAYHHIRSTTIGHALAQSFRALGYRVVAINHLGDWGTTHGMLLAAWQKWGPIEPLDITALNDLYVRFRAEPDADVAGRAWFKRLEHGDADARALWQRFRDVSWAEFAAIYDLLGIHYDEVRGESAYEPDMPRVVADLTERGFLVESEGAMVVELDGEKNPILITTGDGTTLYATRDIAAAEYRWQTYGFARSLYVVDRGQSTHFRQLFKLLAKMGHAWAARCEHVPFGLVRLGGKKTGTRLGNVVLMKQVFDIAIDEVRALIAQKDRELPVETLRQIAIGAVVFANLAPQRDKDIDFDLDKAVSLEGDSGPYLQYSHARCASILRKAGEPIAAAADLDFTRLVHDSEWAIVRRLVAFPDVVVRATEACEPHVICHYLLALAGDYHFWQTAGKHDDALRVLADDPVTRRARLALCGAVKATLAEGLALLGIAAPEQM